jgi:hypothetical protein
MIGVGAEACYRGVVGYSNLMWEAAQEGTDSTAEIIIEYSKMLCPKDTGLLVSTAENKVKKDNRKEYTRELSYATDYVWWVHELPYRHTPPTQWKFLETPMNMYITLFPARLHMFVKSRVFR